MALDSDREDVEPAATRRERPRSVGFGALEAAPASSSVPRPTPSAAAVALGAQSAEDEDSSLLLSRRTSRVGRLKLSLMQLLSKMKWRVRVPAVGFLLFFLLARSACLAPCSDSALCVCAFARMYHLRHVPAACNCGM